MPRPSALDVAREDDERTQEAADEDLRAAAPSPRHQAPAAPDGRQRRPALFILALVVVLAVPLVVALGVLAEPRWYPSLDMAQTELRVRDVGTADSPLVGLAGRFETAKGRGSHPGPLSFWALAPFYRLFGSTSWALQVASASLNLLAMAAGLWIAWRRGGLWLTLGLAGALAILLRLLGVPILTEAWNPYLPVLWWFVFLLAAWSLTCGDVKVLPLAVAAGSFCLQTHISYLLLVPGVGALALAGLAWWTFRRREDAATKADLLRWGLAAGAVGVVLWLPPMLDALTGDPSNLSLLWRHYNNPPEEAIGLTRAGEILLQHLNPFRVLIHVAPDKWGVTYSLVPGTGLVVAWAISTIVAWRARLTALLRLQLILGLATLLGWITLSRVFGVVWHYLSLWAWCLTVLLGLTVVWTIGAVLSGRLGAGARRLAAGAAGVALAGVIVAWVTFFAVDAAYVDVRDAHDTRALAQLVPSTIASLTDDRLYLVTIDDPIALGAQGHGLVLELERAGFDVGTTDFWRAAVTSHRVIDQADAGAEIHLAVGAGIEDWQAKPDVRQVASYDPRTAQERDEYERLRAEVIERLGVDALDDLVAGVDTNLFAISLDQRLPRSTQLVMIRMLELGLPAAVFVGPAPGPG